MWRYREMTGALLGPFEIEIIELFDGEFLKAQAEARTEEGGES